MDRTLGNVLVVVLAGLFVGCSNSAEDTPALTDATPAGNANAPAAVQSAADEPIARAAHAFLDAVIQGDTGRASAMLTPQAVAQIRQSGKAFAPPGLETAGFELGHVRKTSPAKAIVQCFLSDAANDRRAREEMCCILREVEGRWLVSGIAFQISPQQGPVILDFEKPAQSAQSNQPLVGGGSDGQANPPAAAAGGSPVRTAQDPSVPPGR